MAGQQKTEKVVVLGGGPAAIAAAFELTDPSLEGRYEVKVLQPGWRLGGKCASGRNLEAEHGKRIEEHGLHVWFGFYENALRLMRRAYDDLKRPQGHPLRTFEEAFKHCNETVLYDKQGEDWVALPMIAPENERVAGEENPPPGFWDIAKWMCEWAMRVFPPMPGTSGLALRTASRAPAGRLWSELEVVLDDEGRMAGADADLLRLALELADKAQATGTVLLPREQLPPVQPSAGMRADIAVSPESILAVLLCNFRDWLWATSHSLFEEDPHWRQLFTIFDAFASAAAGVVEDGVLEGGWEEINGYDLCEWLGRHGAKRITLGGTPADRAPLLRAIYDVAFGYMEGDIENANVAAGTAVNDLLRLAFNYAGSVMYKMQAGMGDTVLTPFYEVLATQRNVEFKFFSWVTALHLSEDHARVQSIEYVEQIGLEGKGYEPTFEVNGLECWPSEPLWSRIPEGEALKGRNPDFEGEPDPLGRGAEGTKLLVLGKDYDHVVLGIPVGALEPISKEIVEHHPPFAQMLASAVTVRTQAFQLWLTETPQQLGWGQSQNSVAGCYVEPIDTWCDMTQLRDREQWPPSAGVNGLAYFCGVLDHREETPAQARERVKANAEQFLLNHIGPLWPKSVRRGGKAIDWNFLANPGQGEVPGPARLAAQYFRANTRGSELYVLTPKGTVKDRLRADESGVDNLYLAGDWTRNGIDGGCVEAAVASGVQAALAIQGAKRELIGQSDAWLGSPRPGRPSMPPPLAQKNLDAGGLLGKARRAWQRRRGRPRRRTRAGRPPAPTTGGGS